ncbi:hypothetical protein K7W42_11590 [Deinococcus sp. HMF7604]|uniref:hypothetical protein n=1 Tax=Deinococcus betulae TaxID=2873312 RepID=UPI001CCD2A71|nr:hypothetical protein [Deinococcus betulae]MBZ9751506.1 hypothetical protein [Deinococcus betulae]
MKNFVPIVFFVFSFAHAATPANCKGLMLASMSRATYQSQAVFPDEPRTVNLEFFDAVKSPISFCGYVFKPDFSARTLTIESKSLSSFSNIFREGYINTGRIFLENRFYGFENRSTNIFFDPSKYQLGFDKGNSVMPPLTLAAKIDNGPLRPLFYKNSNYAILVPKNAKTLDIYAKGQSEIRVDWQKVTINFVSSSITFYRSSSFPSK